MITAQQICPGYIRDQKMDTSPSIKLCNQIAVILNHIFNAPKHKVFERANGQGYVDLCLACRDYGQLSGVKNTLIKHFGLNENSLEQLPGYQEDKWITARRIIEEAAEGRAKPVVAGPKAIRP